MRTALRFRSVALVLGVLATLLIGQVSMPARGGGFGGGDKKESETFPEPVRTVERFTPMPPKAAKTWLKLQEPISASFRNETPLEDFLKFLKEETRGKDKQEPGIPIYVDPIGMNQAEKTMTSPIIIDLEDVPAATVLDLTLRQLGLRYYVQKDGIVVVTCEDRNPDDPISVGDPTLLLLVKLSMLQTEVSALRREVDALRKGK